MGAGDLWKEAAGGGQTRYKGAEKRGREKV